MSTSTSIWLLAAASSDSVILPVMPKRALTFEKFDHVQRAMQIQHVNLAFDSCQLWACHLACHAKASNYLVKAWSCDGITHP